ncbi:MAG: 26S proteasome non-ATPase regulatory subunit [Cyphobasidiales sp. Tagirdzhanova-0007]|nr:MAG: 26S proteasome non-ATPase regulatory subunit [Cyphobasidiales sp. Tagirdzhanova-0007]
MPEDVAMVSSTDTAADKATNPAPAPPASVQSDIAQNLGLLRSAASILEPRLTLKVLRTTNSIRKRLDAKVLKEVIETTFPAVDDSHAADKQRSFLLGYLDVSKEEMDVDTSSTAATTKKASAPGSAGATRPGTPATKKEDDFIPEIDLYLTLLVIIYFLDTKELQKSQDLVDATVARLGSFNRRTVDQLAAKVYFYYGHIHGLVGGQQSLASIRPQLLSAQRLATLRHDDDLQATLLNLLLRNYFALNLYDQADKLIAKTTFPDTAGNAQLARWLYYVGRIRVIQLNYTEAHTHLQSAIRRAPNATVAPGFLQTVYKLFIIVELLMGDIPERSVFRQPVFKKSLLPYLQIVQAVRVGDLAAFSEALQAHRKKYLSDGTYTLILRLRHNVIKTALRTLSLAYSRISLNEICAKLHLDSEEEAEYVCAKAIRDGVIEASLEHEKGFMKSKDVINIYATNEPQKAFHQRIDFCLQLHNESVKAMRFPMKTHQKELSKAADARERERELAQDIEQNGPGEDDDDAGPEV